MNLRDLSEIATGAAAILLVICISISLPYAWREMKRDWTRLRGQFGIAFCLVCAGIAGHMILAWVFRQVTSITPAAYWKSVEPIGVVLTLLISGGILIAIRAMTVEASGERVWVRSACAAAALSIALWVVF